MGYCYNRRRVKGTEESEPPRDLERRQSGFHKPVGKGGLCGVALGKQITLAKKKKSSWNPTPGLTQKINSEGMI